MHSHSVLRVGGDGTFLHVSSLFSLAHPPVLAFNFGSLGFLTPFGALSLLQQCSTLTSVRADFTNYQTDIPQIFSNSHVTLRSRLLVTVVSADASLQSKERQVHVRVVQVVSCSHRAQGVE